MGTVNSTSGNIDSLCHLWRGTLYWLEEGLFFITVVPSMTIPEGRDFILFGRGTILHQFPLQKYPRERTSYCLEEGLFFISSLCNST